MQEIGLKFVDDLDLDIEIKSIFITANDLINSSKERIKNTQTEIHESKGLISETRKIINNERLI